MAQQSEIEYLGAFTADPDTVYVANTIPSINPAFANANIMEIKTDEVKVQVNGTDAFDVDRNDRSLFDNTATTTYKFNKIAVIAVAKYTTTV